jgi:hypothetical protein
MADEKFDEGVYGENVAEGQARSVSGIREETVHAHPQPTGDAAANPEGADAASEVRTRGAEAVEGSEGTPEDDLDAVRRGAAQDAGSGGMGRDGTPRNASDSQGEFTPIDDKPNTPG